MADNRIRSSAGGGRNIFSSRASSGFRRPSGPQVAFGLFAVLAAIVAGAFIYQSATHPGTSQGGSIAAAGAQAGPGGSFELVDQSGAPVTQDALKGRWSAVFFGYTYCPDICPATLQALGQAATRLSPDLKNRFQVVFVTIDPDRDGPVQMRTYLEAQALPVKTVGLTGTPAQIGKIAKAYKVFFAKVGNGDNYTMDHSAGVYLMDPAGRFSTVLSSEMKPDAIADQIKKAATP